jgi:anti-anti-sigma factor
MGLTVKVKQTKPGIVTLLPVGKIDTNTSPILDSQIRGLLTEPLTTLVLDMEGVDFITSAGIGVITKAKASMVRKNGDLAMINLQPQIKKVFEIMRLVPTLNVFTGIDELDEYLGRIQRKITGQDDF